MNKYWEIIYQLAQKSKKKGEIPVGAIIVRENKIIAKAGNNREKTHNILGHAEVLAIQKASKKLKSWKLDNCDLYVNLKPCTMCENIIKQSRIKNVYYLVEKPEFKKENDKTNFNKCENEFYAKKYKELLTNFFKKLRK